MTIRRTIALAATAFLACAGTVSAAEAPKHAKSPHHQSRHQAAKTVSASKGAVQYGNNTRDNSYGGVYGENSFKGE